MSMPKTAALIPVKHLATGKTRLAQRYDRRTIEQLSLAMLEDVLHAIADVAVISPVVVVTPDPRVTEFARARGAYTLLLSPDPGLNTALDTAAANLARQGCEDLLVLLGDVAGATSQDLEQLLAAGRALEQPCAVLAQTGDGGSGALLRRPHDAIPALFGAGSATAHRRAATARGVAFRALTLPSLSLDIDSADDVRILLRRRRGGQRTRALLQQLESGTAP